MANERPCIQAPITIDASNRFLDVTSVAGGDETVTMDMETYDDIHDLLADLQTGLRALGGDWALALCTVSDTGTVTIDSNQAVNAVALEWLTGANTANTIGTVLGYKVTDDTGEWSYPADYQHMYGWYPNKWPRMYGPLNPKAVGGEQRDTLSGQHSKTVHVAFHHYYDLEYTRLLPKYIYSAESTATPNTDFEHVWEVLIQGAVGRLFEDASDSGTYIEFYLKTPRDWAGAVTRPHIDYKAYSFKMRLRQKEA